MIKLRSFWIALAMGCAVSLGTTSCDEEEEDQPKKEQGNKNQTTDKVVTPEEAGDVMKDIVANVNEKGSSILDQATSMNTEQLKNLASTIIEYGKNRDNDEWVETFVKEAGSKDAVVLLDDVINKLVNDIGVDMSEMTPDILLDAFKEYSKPTDELGEGYQEGKKEGESHKELIAAVYDESFKSIPTDMTGLSQMMDLFGTLEEAQQKELINATLAWSNKEGDEEWKKGFLEGTGLNESDQKSLREKLDYLSQYKSILMMM